MAKRKKGLRKTKTDAVREYMKGHPEALPLEVQSELKKKGIKVTTQSVSGIKYQLGLGRASANGQAATKRGKQSARRKRRVVALSLRGLKSTQRLAGELGGVDNLREHVEALAVARG